MSKSGGAARAQGASPVQKGPSGPKPSLWGPSPLKLGLLVMLLCLGLMVRHYQNREQTDFVSVLERALLDMRFRLRGVKKPSGQIGILSLDEKSVQKFGRFPFTRGVYGKAFQNLRAKGVEWIGLDVFFSEPERRELDQEAASEILEAAHKSIQKGGFDDEGFMNSLGEMASLSTGDLSLGQAIDAFGNVAQGWFYFENAAMQQGLNYDWLSNYKRLLPSAIELVKLPPGKGWSLGHSDYDDIKTWGAITNNEVVAGRSLFQGFVSNEADSDGIIRRVQLVRVVVPVGEDLKPLAQVPPILAPSMSLLLASKLSQREIVVEMDTGGVQSINLMDPKGEKDVLKIPLSQDGKGTIVLNHYGPEETFPDVSLADAWEGKLPEKLPRVLIMGGTATGINDVRPSPFSKTFNGVEHHAAAAENILTGRFVSRTLNSFFLEIAVLVLSGIALSVLLKYTSALKSAVVLLVVLLGYYYFDKLFLFGRGKWFYMGIFYIQESGIFMAVTLYKYFTEEKEKRKIKGAFQHYLNPAVINQLMDNPDLLKLGGEKKELTVFFSDVRGFTTISETLSPEALVHLLNEYFTPMTTLILESGGMLDKYIGDAIMAVWGAPLPQADHADRAVRTSLKMLDALDVLQTKWKQEKLPPVDIGIGLNTGPMSVGNMGSEQRFDYTVMGDAVNLGARLEGINKNYGTRLICSEFTVASLKRPQDFLLRRLDCIQVKGKNEPVWIFEAVRFNPQNVAAMQQLIGHFGLGLESYRQQKWAEARGHFKACLEIVPTDGPALEFLQRCDYLEEHTPGPDWNGVWVFKTK